MHEQAERKTNLRSRRSSTTSGTTSETTAELRSELSRWCTLLALSTSITSAVSSLTISATVTERLALALTLTTHHSAGRCVRSLLLDVGSWDNLGGEVKPFAEVVKTLRGEGVVVILP